jgi:hypothetical protein
VDTEQHPSSATLTDRACRACSGVAAKLSREESGGLLTKLDRGWTIRDGSRLVKEFRFPDFQTALAFVVQISTTTLPQDRWISG